MDFYDTLKLSAGARLALPVIQHLSRSELSATAILRKVREEYDLSISNVAGYAIVAFERDLYESNERLARTNPSNAPNPFAFPEAGSETRNKYAWRLTFEVTNPITGDEEETGITIGSETPMALETAEARAREILNEARNGLIKYEFLEAKTVIGELIDIEGYRRPGMF